MSISELVAPRLDFGRVYDGADDPDAPVLLPEGAYEARLEYLRVRQDQLHPYWRVLAGRYAGTRITKAGCWFVNEHGIEQLLHACEALGVPRQTVLAATSPQELPALLEGRVANLIITQDRYNGRLMNRAMVLPRGGTRSEPRRAVQEIRGAPPAREARHG